MLISQPCGVLSLGPPDIVCTMPGWVAEWAFFLASGGGVLVVIGVWQIGIWRRIRVEGAWLVISVGTAVSTLGFLSSNLLPEVSVTSAEIGCFLGVLGGGLMTWGS